jgi:DNA repair photolyase
MEIQEFQEVNKQAVCGIEPAGVDPKAIKPLFGNKEWAPYSQNCLTGCIHDCRYCYAKAMAIHYKRSRPQEWKNEKLRPNILQKKFHKRDGRILFPSSHDITPAHLSECLTFLKNILTPKNEVLIVTKPHLDCIKAICVKFPEHKDKFLFRFTIGSSDSNTLKFWEPNAPDFAERLESLKYAFSDGYQTSISCEPMLDNNIGDVIDQVIPFVTDAIWIGKANHLRSRLALNGENDPVTTQKAKELMEWQTDKNIKQLYSQYKDNPQIEWKDSIKKVVGLDK